MNWGEWMRDEWAALPGPRMDAVPTSGMACYCVGAMGLVGKYENPHTQPPNAIRYSDVLALPSPSTSVLAGNNKTHQLQPSGKIFLPSNQIGCPLLPSSPAPSAAIVAGSIRRCFAGFSLAENFRPFAFTFTPNTPYRTCLISI